MARKENPTRAHRATGRPKGGARPGAGRPAGSKNTLPMGAVKAIKALNMRAPKEMTDGQRNLLEESESAIVKVMQGKVHGSIATPVLKAAVTVREEIVGPIAQKIQADVTHGFASILDEVAALEAKEKAESEAAEIAKQEEARAVAPKGPVIRKKGQEA